MLFKQLRQKSEQLNVALFSNGWGFIVPYLFIYLIAKYTHVPVSAVRWIFICLHICTLFLFAIHAWNRRKTATITDAAFWLILVLVFVLPGAYLELPADPWEHLRRIFGWQRYSLISDNDVSNKFTYFWAWTLLNETAPLYRRTAAGLYGAFWELLLAYQFYLLALRLGFSRLWARIQVIGTICLFGTNVFSYYRYYALASTIPAYVGYVAALVVILNIIEGRRKEALLLPVLMVFIACNHMQELAFLLISSCALGLAFLWERDRTRFPLKVGLLAIAIGSMAFGYWILQHPEVLPYPGFYPTQPNLSAFAGIRIWEIQYPYYEAIGVCGVVSVAFAILFFSKYRRIALLTLMPVAVLLFSPFVIIYSMVIGGGNWLNWRVLYAFPFSFMLVAGLKEIGEFVRKRFRVKHEAFVAVTVVLLIVLVSLAARSPYRGRLWFALYRPPHELTLERVDVTAQWLFDYRRDKLNCLLTADYATSTVLAGNLGLGPEAGRVAVRDTYRFLNGFGPLDAFLRNTNACALLVPIPGTTPSVPVSTVGGLSGHWAPSLVAQNLAINGDLETLLKQLDQAGWTKVQVPPNYYLFEPPK